MRERSDEDLMKAWANGSMEAFEMLYSRYRAPLYRYLLRLAGDETGANDLYQGAWEKVIAARKRLPKSVYWFIEGGTLYEVMEAMGYAVAEDRLWQMDLFRRQARGTLSAQLGPSMISTDVFLRTIGYSEEELTQLFEELSPDAQPIHPPGRPWSRDVPGRTRRRPRGSDAGR